MIIHGKDLSQSFKQPWNVLRFLHAFLSTPVFSPSHPTSILKSLYPSIHKVINETFKAFWIGQRHCVSKSERQSERAHQRKEKGSREAERIVERAQMYSQLKAVRSCSFHGPIRIKSIPQHHHPLQPHTHFSKQLQRALPTSTRCSQTSTWMVIKLPRWNVFVNRTWVRKTDTKRQRQTESKTEELGHVSTWLCLKYHIYNQQMIVTVLFRDTQYIDSI